MRLEIWLLVVGYFVLVHSQLDSFRNHALENQRLDLVVEALSHAHALSSKILTLDISLGDNLEFRANRKMNLLATRNRLFGVPKKRIQDNKFQQEFLQNATIFSQTLKSNGLNDEEIGQLYRGLFSQDPATRYLFLVGASLFHHLDFWPPLSMSRDENLQGIQTQEARFAEICRESQARPELEAVLFILTKQDETLFRPRGFSRKQELSDGTLFYWRN